MLYFIIGTMLIAIGFSIIRTGDNPFMTVATKTLASMGFVTFAIFASIIAGTKFTASNACLILGTVWGLIGDIVLDVYYSINNKNCLIMGFISFGIGHIFYVLSLVSIMSSFNSPLALSNYLYAILLAAIITVTMYFVCKILKLKTQNVVVVTNIYTFMLCFTVVLSWITTILNTATLPFSIGLTLFLLSDLVLSHIYFGSKRKSNVFQIINHMLYYVAQLLIVCTLFRI